MVTDPTNINAKTQPGYFDRPVIEVVGSSLPGYSNNGFVFGPGSNGSALKGMSINAFVRSNVVLQSNQNSVESCFIGVSADGQTVSADELFGVEVTGNHNTIGGTRNATRGNNLIVGNLSSNIEITGTSASDNVISGNDIGLLLNGSRSNERSLIGVAITDAGSRNRVGGLEEGNDNKITATSNAIIVQNSGPLNTGGANIIQGNQIITTVTGINLESTGDNLIEGNAILGNGFGIFIDNANFPADPEAIDQNKVIANFIGAPGAGNLTGIYIKKGINNQIGSSIASERNVIRSNTNGIQLKKDAQVNVVEGNYIGTDHTGSTSNANSVGVLINGSNNRVIRNIISGNSAYGVGVEADSPADPPPATNIIDANRIGVAVTGDVAVPNPHGIFLNAGSSIITNNLVSRNIGYGILIEGPSGMNIVVGNTVTSNGDDGLKIAKGSTGNTVANVPDPIRSFRLFGAEPIVSIFANNGGSGINIASDAGSGNRIQNVSVYGNVLSGIDIGGDGFTPNDPADADIGPNNLQNYPALVSYQIDGGGDLIVRFSIDSAPENSVYGASGILVEFLKADIAGQGIHYLGSSTYTVADYNSGSPTVKAVNLGNAAGLGFVSGDLLTSIATDDEGNSSEFTPAFSPTAAPVSVSGRIWNGRSGLGKVIVILTAQNGATLKGQSNPFGYYRIENVQAGQTYVVNVISKQYVFDPQVVTVDDNITDLDFLPIVNPFVPAIPKPSIPQIPE